MKNFALIGASGYIAPRHLKAIQDTGNRLIAAADPNDSVGVMDRYFPDARFFTEIERFDRFLEKQRRSKTSDAIEYIAICSPNYLHDAHVRLALRVGAHAICEKPLVINPWNIDALREIEQECGKRIFTVLQLRLLPALRQYKQELEKNPPKQRLNVELTYITARGPWYHTSWKGQLDKSGGIAQNIGVHFFDLVQWLFGEVHESVLHLSQPDKVAGRLELEHASVRWYLSVDRKDLPPGHEELGKAAHRVMTIDGRELAFSEGFADLHTEVYRDILSGGGYGVNEARKGVEVTYKIRTSQVSKLDSNAHPFLLRKM